MLAREQVLIDTCVWVQFFNRPQSAEKRAVDVLLDDNRAALIGPILAKILQGFRRDERADRIASFLSGLNHLEMTWDEWCLAARIGRQVVARGQH